MTRRKKNDGRSRSARRFRQLINAFSGDLGDDLSAAEHAMIRQAALITLQCENVEAAVMANNLEDSDKLVRLSNSATRILTALQSARGKRRRIKNVSLEQYLAGNNDQSEGEEDSEA